MTILIHEKLLLLSILGRDLNLFLRTDPSVSFYNFQICFGFAWQGGGNSHTFDTIT